jgi:hypothetical protein
MDRATTTGRLLLTLALLGWGPLTGCQKHPTMDIPFYPGSSQASGIPNVETEAGTLIHMRRVTPDALRTVADYYRQQVVEQRGWSEQSALGPAFGDGNLQVERPGLNTSTAAPIDPSRPGGFVVVYASQNATYIELWQYLPTVK